MEVNLNSMSVHLCMREYSPHFRLLVLRASMQLRLIRTGNCRYRISHR